MKKDQVPHQEVSKQENDTKQEVSSTSSDKNIASPNSTNVSAVNAAYGVLLYVGTKYKKIANGVITCLLTTKRMWYYILGCLPTNAST